MKVFLSYSRSDASAAAVVGEDVRQMGHAVWYDREITGGQSWWNSIIRQIQECDLFVFVLTPRSLESQACRTEYTYASRLRKRILPVLCHDGVKVNLIPPELSVIQFVDYRAQDKQAAYAMVRALQDVPAADPLPDPLPPEPPVPLSYLGDLRAQIETDQPLPLAEQRELLFKIKPRLKDSESREDAFELLRLLRGREDLLASIAEEIDTLLKRSPQENKTENQTPVKGTVAASHPPATIDLTDDLKALETLVKNIAATSGRWVLQAGKDSLSLSVDNREFVVAAIFHRWTEKEAKRLKAVGWESESKILKVAATGALGVLGAATSGVGLGILMHKGTRDYVTRHVLFKRLLLSQQREVAISVYEAFRILCPETTRVIVSKAEARTKKPNQWLG